LIDENKGALMHNKFCVIDEINTITGSYNWSIKAEEFECEDGNDKCDE
jgi:phosphatidylserine/phosphatidylglycerophosphate/cardiolipin synthase-like enzyme